MIHRLTSCWFSHPYHFSPCGRMIVNRSTALNCPKSRINLDAAIEKVATAHGVRFLNFHPHAVAQTIYIPNNDWLRNKEVESNLNHMQIAIELTKRAKRAKHAVASRSDLDMKDVMRQYNIAVRSGDQKTIDKCNLLFAKWSEQ